MRDRSPARLIREAASVALVAAFAGALVGCAEFSEWISLDNGSEAKAKAEQADLWEMTLMAGRYGVMLDQAREILNLPDPKQPLSFPTDAHDDKTQRKSLATYQVSVVQQFLADAARACKARRVPANVKSIACKDPHQVADALRAPPALELPALSLRNDQVGNVITPWWDAVCAHAPKPKNGEPPACVME
jgi:hypothetical protein